MVGDAHRGPFPTAWGWWGARWGSAPAAAPRTGGFGVGEGEAGLGHPSHVNLVLVGIKAGQAAEGEESFALQVVGAQRVIVEHGQQQAGPLLPALLGGDQAVRRGDEGTITSHPLGPEIQPSLQGPNRLPLG